MGGSAVTSKDDFCGFDYVDLGTFITHCAFSFRVPQARHATTCSPSHAHPKFYNHGRTADANQGQVKSIQKQTIFIEHVSLVYYMCSSLLRGAHLMISSTRRIISAASAALVRTCSLLLKDSMTPSSSILAIVPLSMFNP
jgi:hypothetical protein